METKYVVPGVIGAGALGAYALDKTGTVDLVDVGQAKVLGETIDTKKVTVEKESKGEISSTDYPSSAVPGETVRGSQTAHNTSSEKIKYHFELWDTDTNQRVNKTVSFTVSSGDSARYWMSQTMPDKEWHLEIRLIFEEIV